MKKSLLRLSLAALLVAALPLAAPWAGTAAAGEDAPPAGGPAGAWEAGIEWIAGLLGDLVDPWIGKPGKETHEQPAPRDRDGVTGPVGSGIDPSGITGTNRPTNPPPRKDP